MNTSNHSQFSGSTASSCDVRTVKDESVGSIKEFMVNTHTGQVDYVVLKVNHGFLNLGSKLLALPFDSFDFNTAGRDIILVKESKETLKNAPGFDPENWPSGPQSEFVHEMRTYYSEESRSLHGRFDPQSRDGNAGIVAVNTTEADRPQYQGDPDQIVEGHYGDSLTEGKVLEDSDQTANRVYDEELAEEEDLQNSYRRRESQYSKDPSGEELVGNPDLMAGGLDDDELEEEDDLTEFKDLQNSDDLEDADDYQSTEDFDEDDELNDDDLYESTEDEDSEDVDQDEDDLFDERSGKGNYRDDSESDNIRRRGENLL